MPLFQAFVREFPEALVVLSDLGLDPGGLGPEHHMDERRRPRQFAVNG